MNTVSRSVARFSPAAELNLSSRFMFSDGEESGNWLNL
jgi:hypothetical protein